MVLFSPAVAVEAAVGDGFAEVVRGDVRGCFEVGDGAGNTQYAVVSSCTQSQAVHRLFHNSAALVGQNTELTGELASHLSITMYSNDVLETLGLYGTGGNDTGTDSLAAFASFHLVQLADWDR